MFNGLIKEFAKVKSYSNYSLCLSAKYKPNIGDSIAINGACLSAVKINDDGFCVELSSESAKKLKEFKIGQRVHLEPAIKLGDRIDGHLIQGHIDAVAKIVDIKKMPSGSDFYIQLPQEILKYVANKGSIAVDGVSLTISDINKDIIRLSIIPITLKDTLFSEYKINDLVNIESDLLARYAARILEFKEDKLSWSDVDKITYLY